MTEPLERVAWRRHENAVELGFGFYLKLLERRLRNQPVLLVQELRKLFKDQLGIRLREGQARGLMHIHSSVFIDYVRGVGEETFDPTSTYWARQGLEKLVQWKDRWQLIRKQEAVDLSPQEEPSVPEAGTTRMSRRRTVTVNRIVRDNALGRFLKSVYDSRCQICTYTFMVPGGRKYAETHHLRPLGQPSQRYRQRKEFTSVMSSAPCHV